MKKNVLFIVFLINSVFSFADSPLTSISIYKAYLDISEVKLAKSQGILTYDISNYLSNNSVSIDKKTAVINALYADRYDRSNSQGYYKFLLHKYNTDTSIIFSKMHIDELYSLFLLKVYDNYLNIPDELVRIFEMITNKYNLYN